MLITLRNVGFINDAKCALVSFSFQWQPFLGYHIGPDHQVCRMTRHHHLHVSYSCKNITTAVRFQSAKVKRVENVSDIIA